MERYNSDLLPSRFDTAIKEAVRRALELNVPDLEKIVLFGSCARGKIKAISDVDIAIITKSKLTDRLMRGMLSDYLEYLPGNVDCDVAFLNEESFTQNNSLASNILEDGKILWERR